MVTLVLQGHEPLHRASQMLTEEMGTATNIKSRVNRLSVLSALTSIQQRLKLYHSTPKNGLIVYCGNVLGDDGKERKLLLDFEPYKPIKTTLYVCDNRFHTEPLAPLLDADDVYGVVVICGDGFLVATLAGAVPTVHVQESISLPKKHGRGGQSALRFQRLRLEARHNYVRKVSEAVNQCYMDGNVPKVKGIVLAGVAELKDEWEDAELLDARLAPLVVVRTEVAYGGQRGLAQALVNASYFGYTECVRLLLGAGADIHADNHALRHASCNGHIECVRLLLEAGANAHANNDEALILASRQGHLECVRLLRSS
jgi:peptide chain release factor subunit 1